MKSHFFAYISKIRCLQRWGLKRNAVAAYALRRWSVDCSESHTLVGAEYHLALQNRSALADVDNLSLAPGYSVTPKGHPDLE